MRTSLSVLGDFVMYMAKNLLAAGAALVFAMTPLAEASTFPSVPNPIGSSITIYRFRPTLVLTANPGTTTIAATANSPAYVWDHTGDDLCETSPTALAFDASGTLWITNIQANLMVPENGVLVCQGMDYLATNPALTDIGYIEQIASTTLTEIPTPTLHSSPWAILPGPDGNMWFAEREGAVYNSDGSSFNAAHIGKVDAAGNITEYGLGGVTPGGPQSLAFDSNNNLWYANSVGMELGRVTLAGVVTHYPLTLDQVGEFGPSFVATAPGGKIWYAASQATWIGLFDPNGTPTVFKLQDPSGTNGEISGLAIGKGGLLWFIETHKNTPLTSTLQLTTVSDKIGSLSVTGQVTWYDLPVGSDPEAITAAADGNIWVGNGPGGVAKLATDGTVSEMVLNPTTLNLSSVNAIAFDQHNIMWLAMNSDAVAFLDPAQQSYTQVTPQVATVKANEAVSKPAPSDTSSSGSSGGGGGCALGGTESFDPMLLALMLASAALVLGRRVNRR